MCHCMANGVVAVVLIENLKELWGRNGNVLASNPTFDIVVIFQTKISKYKYEISEWTLFVIWLDLRIGAQCTSFNNACIHHTCVLSYICTCILVHFTVKVIDWLLQSMVFVYYTSREQGAQITYWVSACLIECKFDKLLQQSLIGVHWPYFIWYLNFICTLYIL